MGVIPDGAFVIADLEYTSWVGAHARNWSGPGEFKEIVQIGAVRVSGGAPLTETDAFVVLVAPTLNPRLSGYFSELTGITNADIAREGVAVADALGAFRAFVGDAPVLSHGRDDLVIAEECAEKGFDDPFAGHDWRDISPPIRAVTGDQLMSSELPAYFGLEPMGRAHDALADARALFGVLEHLRRKGGV
ncbi:MAG: exonuclease domain-containing protein [Alphaproteobacteria bacterium]|nr:exonuclease domain-containing protein [Alphaproteobacteria bacterium]